VFLYRADTINDVSVAASITKESAVLHTIFRLLKNTLFMSMFTADRHSRSIRMPPFLVSKFQY